MLKLVLLLSAAALVWGQHGGSWHHLFSGSVIDTVHGLRVQYDDHHNIILFRNHTDCYIVETGDEYTWDHMIRDNDDFHAFTSNVWDKIQTNTGVSYLTIRQASKYHSRLEMWECRNKDLHLVAYYLPTILPVTSTTTF